MGRDKSEVVEYTVTFHGKCESDLKKLRKHNPRLVKEIHRNLEQLKTVHDLGEPLRKNLEGFYSIHLDKYRFRIVYSRFDASRTIRVVAIGHRKSVYSNLARYMAHHADQF